MSDPLFGTFDLGGEGLLFSEARGVGAPAAGRSESARSTAGEDDDPPALPCSFLPWHSGAFGLLIPDFNEAGSLTVEGPRGPIDVLKQTRLLRPKGYALLLILNGTAPTAAEGAIGLSATDDGGNRTFFSLQPARATIDRTLASLVAQVLVRDEDAPGERKAWHPLTRFLASSSELAARAALSIPFGTGMALVLDGDIGATGQQPIAFTLDGARLNATKAQVGVDPQTGRSLVLLPEVAARCFVMLDDGLVDLACPPGARRSTVARTADAMPLRTSEGGLLLDMAAKAELGVGPAAPDWLPAPHALGWRSPDGGNIAVIGAVAVEAGTVVFLASDGREHELAGLVVRDLSNAAAPLFAVAEPIAAFHPDADRQPDRQYLVVLLRRRLGAGALHIALSGTSDEGGWIRTLDAASGRAQAIVKAWMPPPPADGLYLRAVAAPIRTLAARIPFVVAADMLPDPVRSADMVIVVVALDAAASTLERTLESLAASQSGIPVVIVLNSGDPGYNGAMQSLVTTAHRTDAGLGTIAVAGPASAGGVLSTSFARIAAGAVIAVDAGATVGTTDWRQALAGQSGAPEDNAIVVASGEDEPAGVLLTRRAAERWLPVLDPRLASLPVAIGDLVQMVRQDGGSVSGVTGFDVVADPDRTLSFEAMLDRALLQDRDEKAALRGTS